MSMTKKDFDELAAALRMAAPPVTAGDMERAAFLKLRDRLADYCANTNPKFDRARFLAAAVASQEPKPAGLHAYAPNGKPILGTLERLDGRAEIQEGSFTKEKGKLSFEWEGGTEIFWDGQMTAVDGKGRRIFLDEEGNEWTENQITLRKEAR